MNSYELVDKLNICLTRLENVVIYKKVEHRFGL